MGEVGRAEFLPFSEQNQRIAALEGLVFVLKVGNGGILPEVEFGIVHGFGVVGLHARAFGSEGGYHGEGGGFAHVISLGLEAKSPYAKGLACQILAKKARDFL